MENWKETAARMIAEGSNWSQVAKAVGKVPHVVRYNFDPEYKAEWQAKYRERWHSDTAWRQRQLERLRRDGPRYRIRKEARAEAAETGEPVEAVYKRFGVA